MIRLKFCGIQDEKELETAVRTGANAVGFRVGQIYRGEFFILPSTAYRLARETPVFIEPVLVTQLTEEDALLELLEKTSLRTLQLPLVSSELLERLRKRGGEDLKLIPTVYPEEAERFRSDSFLSPNADALTLVRRGRPPREHEERPVLEWRPEDWSAKFFPGKPMVLSGGIRPDEIRPLAEAFGAYAMDFGTELRAPDGTLCEATCQTYAEAAQ